MASNEHSAEQQILSNKHLKECNDNLASETEALYQLRCKHGVERDELVFEKITDNEKQSRLTCQQHGELDALKQQNNESRMAMQKRHLSEDDSLQRKLATIAQQRKTPKEL